MNDLITQQFYEYLEKFLKELSKSSKDLKKLISKDYKKINNEKYLNEIKDNIYLYKKNFLGKEEELDKFFEDNNVELLKGINISDIWSKSDSDNKNAIIQYIKVFVFMFESSNKNTDKENTIKENTDKENDTSEEEDISNDDSGFEEMLKKSLLDNDENMKSFYESLSKEDNSIVGLARNIACELKDDSEGGLENMMNLFKDGQGLNSLVSKITSKLDNKLKTGELDQTQLLSDAQKMMSGNNNLFGNMFNNLNQQTQQQTQQTQQQTQQQNNVSINDTTCVEQVQEEKEVVEKKTKKTKKKTKK